MRSTQNRHFEIDTACIKINVFRVYTAPSIFIFILFCIYNFRYVFGIFRYPGAIFIENVSIILANICEGSGLNIQHLYGMNILVIIIDLLF